MVNQLYINTKGKVKKKKKKKKDTTLPGVRGENGYVYMCG